MAITRLALTDFRNHASVLIAPDTRFVLLTGANGAGKTNIVEAVSLLTPGRGLRRAALSDMARADGPGGFAIAAELMLPGGAVEIGTGASVSAPDRRLVRVNGATASQQALAEWTAVAWLTPAMDRLFVEGAGGRRRFLDRLALALVPGHALASARYEQGLRERNRLLSGERAPEAAWLDAVEDAMAPAAAAIVRARVELVEALTARLAAEPDGPFARPELTLADKAGGPVPAEAEEWTMLWRATRARDRGAGRTLAGPHRAELDVIHADKRQPAARCSTGEQKAMLIAILLAHAALVAERRGAPPLLLLDEVAAHLDPARRSALFERLEASGSQVWMTGTEPAPFAEILGFASHYVLGDGRTEAVNRNLTPR